MRNDELYRSERKLNLPKGIDGEEKVKEEGEILRPFL